MSSGDHWRNICAAGFLVCLLLLLIVMYANQDLFSLREVSYREQIFSARLTNSVISSLNQTELLINSNLSHASNHCITYEPMGRLGNQMFSYSSTLGLSVTNNMHFLFPGGNGPDIDHEVLQQVFKLDISTMDNFEMCKYKYFVDLSENNWSRRYVTNFTDLEMTNTSIRIHGYLQSYRYFDRISSLVRKAFTFIDPIQQKADKFYRDIEELLNIDVGKNTGKYIKVGVHVRMGDFRSYHPDGVRLAPMEFYMKAATAFLKNYTQILFVVSTQPEEEKTVKAMFMSFERDLPRAKVVFAPLQSAGEDMAILAACNNLIISIGSFGWWAGWLTGGTVIYYDNWIRQGSEFGKRLETEARFQDHYPPSWIPMH